MGGTSGTIAISYASDGTVTLKCNTSSLPPSCTPPAYPNGSVTCDATGAFVYTCNAGFADVNGVRSDGCEVDLLTDVKNCGGVGNDVTNLFPHATAACAAGRAFIAGCDPGWFDANFRSSDGCEAQDEGAGSTQATATAIGVVPFGTSATVLGLADPVNSDWYFVVCPQGCTITATLVQPAIAFPVDVWTSTSVARGVTTYTVPPGGTAYVDVPIAAAVRYTVTVTA